MKVAIIGCGSIGQRHARNVRVLGVRELLLVDPREERAERLAQELNAKAFRGPEEAYADRPEIALICAPTSLHMHLAKEALRNNCHVFVEKPLTDSAEGARELIELATVHRKLLLAGYNLRFDAIAIQIREWLESEKIGRVTSARFHFGSYLPWRHPWEDYRVGYGARRDLGGGVILDAIHELDLAGWLFGTPRVMFCAGGKYSDLEMDAEDLAEMLLLYPDKIVSLHLDYLERPAERWCEITGTEGRIVADLFCRTARYFDGRERAWKQMEKCGAVDDTYISEMRHLLDCVAGRATPAVDGVGAMESLLLAEKAKASMRTGLPVLVREGALMASAR